MHSMNTEITVDLKSIVGEPTTKILSIRYDEEDKYIAAGNVYVIKCKSKSMQ